MAEEEVRHVRPLLRRQAAQRLDVRRDLVPAVLHREEADVLRAEHALAVAEMVVAHDDEALRGQEAREIRVAAYVLVDAVRELHHAVYVAVRHPLAHVYGRRPVGRGEGVIIFGDYGHFHLPPHVLFFIRRF